MIALPAKAFGVAVLLAISFSACSRSGLSPFQRESQWLQAIWSSDAELTHSDVPQQSASEMQERWGYQFSGRREAAVKLLRSHTPAGYTLVRESDSELSFARWDGHDSYQLTLTFEDSTNQTTMVSVILKSFPD
jgi:hypothetical protein